MDKRPGLSKIFMALSVAALGFILLNAAFIFDFLYQSAVRLLLRPLIGPEVFLLSASWIHSFLSISFAAIIVVISYFVLKSDFSIIIKAAFFTVPVATALITVGLAFYRQPVLAFALCGLICALMLRYMYMKKVHWLYYYALLLTASTLAIMTLSGVDI